MLDSGQELIEVPYDVTQRFGLIDLADVAEAAAAVLLDGSHAGATYEVGGPALVTPTDVADAASAVLGRTVTAKRVDAGEGVHPWLRAMFAYYDGHGLPAGPLTATALLGRPPRTLEETLRRELR
jgi:nucleoside-diphosphate-sugar epimerase